MILNFPLVKMRCIKSVLPHLKTQLLVGFTWVNSPWFIGAFGCQEMPIKCLKYASLQELKCFAMRF